MSALNWIKTAGGLFTPYHTIAPWRFLPCPTCCAVTIPGVISECYGNTCNDDDGVGGIPQWLKVDVGSIGGVLNCAPYTCQCNMIDGENIVGLSVEGFGVCKWSESGLADCTGPPPALSYNINVELTGGKLFCQLLLSCIPFGEANYVSDSLGLQNDCLAWDGIVLNYVDPSPIVPSCSFNPTISISASPDPDDL